jgi:trehalose 6-phosphate synthase
VSAKSRIGGFVKRLNAPGRLIVVSNREPFSHEWQGGRLVCRRPAGGLTSALGPLLGKWGGTWIAHGSGSADRDAVDAYSHVPVPPDHPSYTLRRVWLPEKLRTEYYSGLANRALWPLCHNVYQRPQFSSSDWDSYRAVNKIFAQAVLEEAADEPCVVFIQDYHLALLPRMLKAQNSSLAVAHFWHIPWPAAESFSAFPWGKELLDGLLGNDLLGFHLSKHCQNFLDSVDQAERANVDHQNGQAINNGISTTVGAFPIGIDFNAHREIAGSSATLEALHGWKNRIGTDVQLGIGIDRIDYTKGIPERIRALDLFFKRHREWREKLVFLQVGVPCRTDICEYRQIADEIREQIRAMNARWQTDGWKPIHYVEENQTSEQMIALHRLATFCLVTPLHDGMNLVAKEFVASRSDLDGVLVLSRFAGAADTLTDAILVNPFSENDIADGIWRALTLPASERRERMGRMHAIVQGNTVYKWASDILLGLMRSIRTSVPTPGYIDATAPGYASVREVSLA